MTRRHLNLFNYNNMLNDLIVRKADLSRMEKRLEFIRQTGKQVGGGKSTKHKQSVNRYHEQMVADLEQERNNIDRLSSSIQKINFDKPKYADSYCGRIDDNYARLLKNETKLANNMARLVNMSIIDV